MRGAFEGLRERFGGRPDWVIWSYVEPNGGAMQNADHLCSCAVHFCFVARCLAETAPLPLCGLSPEPTQEEMLHFHRKGEAFPDLREALLNYNGSVRSLWGLQEEKEIHQGAARRNIRRRELVAGYGKYAINRECSLKG